MTEINRPGRIPILTAPAKERVTELIENDARGKNCRPFADVVNLVRIEEV